MRRVAIARAGPIRGPEISDHRQTPSQIAQRWPQHPRLGEPRGCNALLRSSPGLRRVVRPHSRRPANMHARDVSRCCSSGGARLDVTPAVTAVMGHALLPYPLFGVLQVEAMKIPSPQRSMRQRPLFCHASEAGASHRTVEWNTGFPEGRLWHGRSLSHGFSVPLRSASRPCWSNLARKSLPPRVATIELSASTRGSSLRAVK
jgi:hypothetical protein